MSGARQRLLLLFLLAVVFRIATAGFAINRSARGELENRTDQGSYMVIVDMLFSGERPTNSWHERVFWGFPLASAPFRFVFSARVATLLASILLSGVAVCLFDLVFANFRLSCVFALFPPAWLYHSSMGMSESALLVGCLLSLWAFRRKWWVSGLSMAFAALVRPLAVLLALPLFLNLLGQKAWKRALCWGALAALGPLCQILLNVHFYHSWNRQAELHASPQNLGPAKTNDGRTYFNLPLKALIKTPLEHRTPPWKIAYVYLNAAWVLLATALLVRARRLDFLTQVCADWGVLNTAFIISTGPYWGFHSFDRYLVWALPAYLLPWAGWVTRISPAWLVAGASGSFAMAVWAAVK